jgi:hypothetical protein
LSKYADEQQGGERSGKRRFQVVARSAMSGIAESNFGQNDCHFHQNLPI